MCAAAGRYPPLRFGRQPYGVLPVTSLDLWKPPRGQEHHRPATLGCGLADANLRDNSGGPPRRRIPRSACGSPTPTADLADVMHTDGLSQQLATRCVFSRRYLEHLAAPGQGSAANGSLPPGALTRRPPPAGHRPAAAPGAHPCPPTWPGRSPPLWCRRARYRRGQSRAGLHRRALGRAAHRRPDRTPARCDGDCGHASLLQMLLRHALLRELADAAAQIARERAGRRPRRAAARPGTGRPGHRRAPGADLAAPAQRIVAAVTGTSTIRAVLEG